ncbi:hypothetical protein MIND_01025500 [Mycena indigotica]|uniref:Transmembrane protein n=1 Tax=Mycena indigotica TaxID=2126181 RepID=A0A8H6S8I9_9AGAR|nr:uncharacterized protein MIND_01025500 [Mycena indigotica]KAF7294876.1 hypothetical protein MIND_01025500 [Mycena indigotica]
MEIELDDFSQSRRTEEVSEPTATAPTIVTTLDAVGWYWAWGAATLLTIVSICLFFTPRILLLLSSADQRNELTSLESFLCLHGSIWLFALAVGLVLNVPSASPADLLVPRNLAPRHPLLIPVTTASCVSAFVAYNTSSIGSLATLVPIFAAIIGVWGAWAAIFGDSASVSKKTGADKHTSAFIFGNKSAASSQKKEWLKQRKTAQ